MVKNIKTNHRLIPMDYDQLIYEESPNFGTETMLSYSTFRMIVYLLRSSTFIPIEHFYNIVSEKTCENVRLKVEWMNIIKHIYNLPYSKQFIMACFLGCLCSRTLNYNEFDFVIKALVLWIEYKLDLLMKDTKLMVLNKILPNDISKNIIDFIAPQFSNGFKPQDVVVYQVVSKGNKLFRYHKYYNSCHNPKQIECDCPYHRMERFKKERNKQLLKRKNKNLCLEEESRKKKHK